MRSRRATTCGSPCGSPSAKARRFGVRATAASTGRRTDVADAEERSATSAMTSPEDKNCDEIVRLEERLRELRTSASTPRETEALREAGLEIALAVREVGAMLVNVGWEQTFAHDGAAPHDAHGEGG